MGSGDGGGGGRGKEGSGRKKNWPCTWQNPWTLSKHAAD